MPSATEIRAGLVEAREKRERAAALQAEGTSDLRRWLKAAQANSELTMEEAAGLGGFTRESAYAFLKKGK